MACRSPFRGKPPTVGLNSGRHLCTRVWIVWRRCPWVGSKPQKTLRSVAFLTPIAAWTFRAQCSSEGVDRGMCRSPSGLSVGQKSGLGPPQALRSRPSTHKANRANGRGSLPRTGTPLGTPGVLWKTAAASAVHALFLGYFTPVGTILIGGDRRFGGGSRRARHLLQRSRPDREGRGRQVDFGEHISA